MKGQKEAVIELVKRELPNFNLYKDIALILLSKDQLENIKREIGDGLYDGTIEYGKTDKNDVYPYARSMVMNHLKKAKELNGNQVYGKSQAVVESTIRKNKLSTICMDALPDELKAYVETLV